MSVGWILGVCVLTVVGATFLKTHHPAYGLLVALAGGIVILLSVVVAFSGIREQLETMFADSGVNVQWFTLLIKALGIGYLCRFASDLCRDAGETALAGYVELAGKVMIVVLSFPLLEQVAQTVKRLILL